VRAASLGTASIVARRQILDLDGPSLVRAVAAYATLSEGCRDLRIELDLALLRQWRSLARNEARLAQAEIKQLERDAVHAGLAPETIEAAVVRALAEEQAGELRAALDTARRAVRMARTEGLPQSEHIAALTLARIRRRNNQAHLAARVTSALRAYVPSLWRGWLDWESALASGVGNQQSEDDHHLDTLKASLLLQWLSAASAGRRDQMVDADRRLSTQLHGWEPARADFAQARLAIDPAADATGLVEIHRWRNGEHHELPSGLIGLAAGSPHAQHSMAYVISRPSGRGVRVLCPGAGLADSISSSERSASAKQARPQALIAVLALAGPEGLAEDETFARAYGFAFNPELHRDAFNVTVHRTRAYLGDVAKIDRSDGRMTVSQCVAFPDSRCAWPLGDHVLRCVAQAGSASASDIAEALGISLRSTQATLAELLEDGGCIRRKAGRNVEYALEDTTFQMPTHHR
jgi:hypothetical protein